MNKICILIGLVLMSFCCCMGVKSVGGGLFRVQVDGMYGYIYAPCIVTGKQIGRAHV